MHEVLVTLHLASINVNGQHTTPHAYTQPPSFCASPKWPSKTAKVLCRPSAVCSLAHKPKRLVYRCYLRTASPPAVWSMRPLRQLRSAYFCPPGTS